MEKILDVYKRIMDIRLVKAQIEALDLPDGSQAVEAAAGPLEDYAGSMMAREVETIASELVREFAVADLPAGRANELEIEIRRSLTSIAGRVDDRYNISVRTGPIPELEADGDEEHTEAEIDEVTRLAREVQGGYNALQFMNLTGSPILGLQATSDEAASTDGPTSDESDE
ncbi:MAG: hypothetical protein GY701_12790 [Sulfitobacter sp.]|nr:hypothetical protein [Sulfitobacter sp.]